MSTNTKPLTIYVETPSDKQARKQIDDLLTVLGKKNKYKVKRIKRGHYSLYPI